jgi:hypothetical protein
MTTRPHNVCNSSRTTHKLYLIPSTTKISIKSTYIFQDGPPPQDWCASVQHEISHFNLQVSSQCIYITARIPYSKVFAHFKHANQDRQFKWVAFEHHYSTQHVEYHNTKFFSFKEKKMTKKIINWCHYYKFNLNYIKIYLLYVQRRNIALVFKFWQSNEY